MSFQGNLNQAFPSDPSSCPPWPSKHHRLKKKNARREKHGKNSYLYIYKRIFDIN